MCTPPSGHSYVTAVKNTFLKKTEIMGNNDFVDMYVCMYVCMHVIPINVWCESVCASMPFQSFAIFRLCCSLLLSRIRLSSLFFYHHVKRKKKGFSFPQHAANTFPSNSKLIHAVRQGNKLKLLKPPIKFDKDYTLVMPQLWKIVSTEFFTFPSSNKHVKGFDWLLFLLTTEVVKTMIS